MTPDLIDLQVRFENLRELYLTTFNRAQECRSPNEKKCILHKLRSIIVEARSVALEFRIIVRSRLEPA